MANHTIKLNKFGQTILLGSLIFLLIIILFYQVRIFIFQPRANRIDPAKERPLNFAAYDEVELRVDEVKGRTIINKRIHAAPFTPRDVLINTVKHALIDTYEKHLGADCYHVEIIPDDFPPKTQTVMAQGNLCPDGMGIAGDGPVEPWLIFVHFLEFERRKELGIDELRAKTAVATDREIENFAFQKNFSIEQAVIPFAEEKEITRQEVRQAVADMKILVSDNHNYRQFLY